MNRHLEFGGFSDCRLQCALNIVGSGPCIAVNCAGNEFAQVLFNEPRLKPGTSALTADPNKLALYVNASPTAGYWTSDDSNGFPVFFSAQVQADLPSTGPIPLFDGLPAAHARQRGIPVPQAATAMMMLAGLGA